MRGLPSTGALAPERDLLIAEFELTAARYDRAEDAIHRVLATEPGPRLEARTWLLQAAVLGEKGDYKGARRAAEVAAATIQSLPEGQDLQIHGWHTSGLIKLGTGDPQGALADFGKAFDATEVLYGPGHLHSVRALSHRGLAKKALGDLPGSLAEHDRALALDRTLRGPGHPLLARHYHNRGGVLRLLKRFDDALASSDRAKELRVASFAPEHPRVALTLNSMGLVELDRGDLNAAAKRFERAALLLEAAGDHRRARPLTNQALVLERRRKRLAALRAYRRARAAWVSGVGDGAPQVAEVERAIARLSAKAKPAKTPPKAAVGAGKPDPAEGKPKPAGPAVSPSYGSTPTWTRQ